MTTYYITKYALSGENAGKPIETSDIKHPADDDGYVSVMLPGFSWATSFKLGRDIFDNLEDANTAIRKARDKKVASLKQQINKLEALKV